MKFLLLPIFLIISSFSTPPKKTSISLSRNYKVENTFSGDTHDSESFHLIIAKNSKLKQCEIIPISNTDGELNQLKSVAFKKMPNVVSYHNNGNILTLVVSSKGKKEDEFTVVDINLKTGESERSDPISDTDFKTVIRKKKSNLLVFSDKTSLNIIDIKDSKTFNTITGESTETTQELLKDLNKSSLSAVNTDEYVANGSINTFRAYAEDNTVFITKEDAKENETSVVKIPLNGPLSVKLESKIYKSKALEDAKKSTSYVQSGQLFQMSISKSVGHLSVFNLQDDSETNLDLATVKVSKTSSDFESISEFLKQATRAKNEPTVTINDANNGNVVVRVDYVNKKEYNYNYNWWWHHNWAFQHHMMMMHQQIQIQQQMRGFGPNNFDEVPYFIKDEKHHFEIVLTQSNTVVVDSDIETIYKDIDKKKYIKELDDNTKVKHTSTVFIENQLRYFGYDKKTKKYSVIYKEIND